MNAQQLLNGYSKELNQRLNEIATLAEIPAGTEILKEGQYVKLIPVVLSGLVKVFTRKEERELLLYFIQPAESCIISFSASLTNEKSSAFAKTDEDSKLLLIPAESIPALLKEFPELNGLFYQQYRERYNDLLETINQLVFEHLDKRLYTYLKDVSSVRKENPLKLSHREIASEMGTVREVISRAVKKLEKEGKVEQLPDSIKIL